MDLKEIASKVVAGEDTSSLTKDFKPEQIVELDKLVAIEAKAASAKELDALKGIREEKNRVTNKANEGHNQVVSEVKLSLKKEALVDARTQFFAGRKVSPEKQAEIDAIAQTIDLNLVPVNQVYPRAYAQANAEVLLQAEEAQRQSAANALNFNAAGAGANGAAPGSGGGEPKVYSPLVNKILQDNARRGGRVRPMPLTAEEVERGLKASDGWRDLPTT